MDSGSTWIQVDTDGDGLPDGFEISMCTDGGAGYIDQASTAWVSHFDPLTHGMQSKIQINAWVYSSGDVEMDKISTGRNPRTRTFTSTEEYRHAQPNGWIDERTDFGVIPIPGITEGACQSTISRKLITCWLGSDQVPRL